MSIYLTKNEIKQIAEAVSDEILKKTEDLLSMEEAARYLKYRNLKTFYGVYKNFPHAKVNGKIYFRKSQLNGCIK